MKVRAHTSVTVRSGPQRYTGTTNGRDWEFFSVELLDFDFNKFEGTLADHADHSIFTVGKKLDVVLDLSSGGRLRAVIVEAVETGKGKLSTVAAA